MKTFLLALFAVILMGLVLVFVPLFPVHAQVASITLDWTAPGDDGVIGTASSYQVRWSATKPDTTTTAAMNAWWSAAASVATLPAPAIAGTAQSVAVPGPFTTGQTYYFVILACDEVPNCATYSNVASKFLPDTVPPSRIVDLRTR